ncbi:MAG TPA: hypothetical protein VFV70_01580 [Hyphomonadaceae bacterium]|nr:hypothetical protein [Hyphomonadaceae bacterium]
MKITIRIEAMAALALACAPAFAQAPPSDTIKAVLAKGAIFTVQGQDYEFIPKGDGSYANFKGDAMGRYRVDGRALCITPDAYRSEACFELPETKKSGDRFDVTNEHGQPAGVTIR